MSKTIYEQTFKTKGDIKEEDISDKYEPKESCDNHPSMTKHDPMQIDFQITTHKHIFSLKNAASVYMKCLIIELYRNEEINNCIWRI